MSELPHSCRICAFDLPGPAVRSELPTGQVLMPARHVPDWTALKTPEKFALLALIDESLAAGEQQLRSGSIDGHFLIRLGPAPAPANDETVLATGGTDPLFPLLATHLDRAHQVDLAVAFALPTGVDMLVPRLEDLLARGGRLRIIVGDYLDVTEPRALRQILDLSDGAAPGLVEPHVFETLGGSFHPKAWLFRADAEATTIVGSSNLSRTALTAGVEWNLATAAPQAVSAVTGAFAALLADPRVKPLTNGWIDSYAARRRAQPLPVFAQKVAEDEPPPEVPEPHGVQVEALAALGATRAAGHRAGLVVMATGLGKTWLAAFDSRPFDRVLFVAHREEILAQAMATFRQIRPEARFGRYSGTAKEPGEIIFASIQTLGRAEHLRRFAPDDFDYVVMDEFHHAAAASYRALLEHFQPQFLLGLTATPERTDGGDLLGLCGENLVYRCDLWQGIEGGYLAPFRYLGVPDAVDYAQIPWRSSRFDEEALTTALATRARAENALDQFRKHGNGPAIGFCASLRHAEFMAGFFRDAGLHAVAVHSGAGSAPRTASLEALGRGEIDILFAVDMFNEGVDVPQIGTVLMLRPTESAILFLQQLGRGLRQVAGKTLQVIDYIGNHRVFLTKVRALLEAGEGDRSLSRRLDEIVGGETELPPGCEITYELEVLEMLRQLVRQQSGGDEGEAWYLDFRLRLGTRPTASEFARGGFDPARTGHGGWFQFVRDMGDPVPASVLDSHRALVRMIEAGKPDPDTLLLLAAGAEALSQGIDREGLHRLAQGLAARVMTERLTAENFSAALQALMMSPHVREEMGKLRYRRAEAGGEVGAAVRELAEWRLGCLEPAMLPKNEVAEIGTYRAGPVLWQEYMRADIAPLFGDQFNAGKWNSGIVPVGDHLVLLTTLKKGSMATGNHYEDRFLSPTRMEWQSQTRTQRGDSNGRILSGQVPDKRVHLFVRSEKLRGTTAAPFLYLGQPKFVDWHGEKPITITWDLPEPVPDHLRRMLRVPGEEGE